LLVHKATHHFDLLNWWIDSEPEEVFAFGKLDVYGKNNSFRSDKCRVVTIKTNANFTGILQQARIDAALCCQ
jgi:predicted dehydrogenase